MRAEQPLPCELDVAVEAPFPEPLVEFESSRSFC